MESYKSQEGIEGEDDLDLFKDELSLVLGEPVSIECVGGTYEIEVDNLTLTFVVDDSLFEIRLIDTHGNSGLGSQVLDVVHNYADENGLDVIASNVVDEARGFWESNYYQEGEEENQFYRVA